MFTPIFEGLSAPELYAFGESPTNSALRQYIERNIRHHWSFGSDGTPGGHLAYYSTIDAAKSVFVFKEHNYLSALPRHFSDMVLDDYTQHGKIAVEFILADERRPTLFSHYRLATQNLVIHMAPEGPHAMPAGRMLQAPPRGPVRDIPSIFRDITHYHRNLRDPNAIVVGRVEVEDQPEDEGHMYAPETMEALYENFLLFEFISASFQQRVTMLVSPEYKSVYLRRPGVVQPAVPFMQRQMHPMPHHWHNNHVNYGSPQPNWQLHGQNIYPHMPGYNAFGPDPREEDDE